VGTVRDALQLPDMRRIELGYGMSITGATRSSPPLPGTARAWRQPTRSRHNECPPIRHTAAVDLLRHDPSGMRAPRASGIAG
jgi:hypothetical protein